MASGQAYSYSLSLLGFHLDQKSGPHPPPSCTSFILLYISGNIGSEVKNKNNCWVLDVRIIDTPGRYSSLGVSLLV